MVQVVYDEPAILDDYEGVDIETLTRELSPKNPFALNLMRITVDGEPIDDPGRSSADIQRCTDVALEKADILFQFDNLHVEPAAQRVGVADDCADGGVERGRSVTRVARVTRVIEATDEEYAAGDSGRRAARADGRAARERGAGGARRESFR